MDNWTRLTNQICSISIRLIPLRFGTVKQILSNIFAWRLFISTRLGLILFILSLFFVVLITLDLKQAEAGYASIVIDADTGDVLRSRNADTRNYPASLTKMMTLYLLFDELDKGRMSKTTKMKVSKRAAGQPASKLGLSRGQFISVGDAIKGLTTKSANDVATVVAEFISGTEWEFAIEMTKRARKLGMRRTSFRNSSGLPNRRQLSTARDMGILALSVLRDFPHHYHYFSSKSFKYRGQTFQTHNNLLAKYKGMDGMKTGYIRASGFNLVASAVRNDRRVVAVVFGGRTAKSRDRHIIELLDLGFKRIAIRDAQNINRRTAAKNNSKTPIPVFRPNSYRSTKLKFPLPVRRPRMEKWAIQVGAYQSVVAAEQALKVATDQLPLLLSDAVAELTPVKLSRGNLLYRASFFGLNKGDATMACRSLIPESLPCAVLPNPYYRLATSLRL